MRLGLGTGSTARHFVDLLGEKVRAGLEVVGVPTSAGTAAQAAAAGIALTNLDDTPNLDLTVDGADEFDGARRLIKGGGGALLREKIVAAASAGMVVIVDSSKEVERLGRFRLPVEVDRFGLRSTEGKVRDACGAAGLSGAPVLRTGVDKTAFVTDGGHLILDCPSGAISNPEALATALDAIPGVLGHGLFLGLATAIIIADGESVRVVGASAL